MKVMPIPDIHLKPWIFDRAAEVMTTYKPDMAVCLMDIPDDWGQVANIRLYEESFDAAIRFAKGFPETLWCYGNHELSYVWQKAESGYSDIAARTVRRKIDNLRDALKDWRQIAYIHRIDDVLFMHGGLCEEFVRSHVAALEEKYNDTDAVVEAINAMGKMDIWKDISPIWHRPQISRLDLYRPDTLLQVVGHTPVRKISRTDNVISCDVFSNVRCEDTFPSGKFIILDTEDWSFVTI